jgi:hypothetical protein
VEVNEVVAALLTSLVTPEAARLKPNAGGVPNEPGLYAWFCDSEALPDVTFESGAAEHRVIYVGIAPSRPGSRQTLRGRICGNHLRGNISGSTFRLSLAALLWQQEHWSLTRRGNRALLAPSANEALSAWQRRHLRVSWVGRRNPWDIESQVIKAMSPWLNLAENRQHAYGWTLSEARQRLRSAALSAPPYQRSEAEHAVGDSP